MKTLLSFTTFTIMETKLFLYLNCKYKKQLLIIFCTPQTLLAVFSTLFTITLNTPLIQFTILSMAFNFPEAFQLRSFAFKIKFFFFQRNLIFFGVCLYSRWAQLTSKTIYRMAYLEERAFLLRKILNIALDWVCVKRENLVAQFDQ